MWERVDSFSFSIHKHSFGGLVADTLTFCESALFSGKGRLGGGGSAFSKAELRFPVLFVAPPVYYDKFVPVCTIFMKYRTVFKESTLF